MNNLMPWKRKQKEDTKEVTNRRDGWHDQLFRYPFADPFESFLFPTRHEFDRDQKWLPDIDINEDKSKITVEAEIPGMEKDDIQIYLDGRRLTIKGEKQEEEKTDKKGVFRRERSYGYFNRSVELPAEVDENSISAKYKKGVLKVEMKKTEAAKEKAIPVKTG